MSFLLIDHQRAQLEGWVYISVKHGGGPGIALLAKPASLDSYKQKFGLGGSASTDT